jgi:thioredoxin reductase (NADPH)
MRPPTLPTRSERGGGDVSAMASSDPWEVIIVGGGLAGLSAGIYLGRALRKTLIIDQCRSLALWEPEVQNYLGFPDGIAGEELLKRGRAQGKAYGVSFVDDAIRSVRQEGNVFALTGEAGQYRSARLLLATGLYHLPPDIPGVNECLGQSMFFCKDCDAYRVQGKRIAVIGCNNEAIEYALAMLLYSSCVIVATNGKPPAWDEAHARWANEYHLPIFEQRILQVEHTCGQVASLAFADHGRFAVEAIFTTRGDVYHNALAQDLAAATDPEGQVVVNEDGLTSIPGLYAAGCVTAANCQMIIAAGQGATAAQAINRNLFEESLRNHSLRQVRQAQLETAETVPEAVP